MATQRTRGEGDHNGYPDPHPDAQRKAAAQKAAATRRRNAAKRSHSAKKAAETRAQAELNTLQVVQLQAERAALIPVGAALTARDAVVEAKPYVAGRESAERSSRRSASACRSASSKLRAPRLDRPQPRAARGQAHPHPRGARAASAPQLGRPHGEAEPSRGRAPGEVDPPPVRAPGQGRAPRVDASPKRPAFDRRASRRFPRPAEETGPGESCRPHIRRQCSISPPSPAPSPSGAALVFCLTGLGCPRVNRSRTPSAGHRPRAAQGHRVARHGALDRAARRRHRGRGRLAHHGGLPDPQPLPDGGRREGPGARASPR